ncbi:MAG: hypothetical protein KatS3mg108_0642 [Isosphaeraceae bacterium]|nr:MAG: hypothetical protein KatS3mg108_0642 [Isosphaeraceae bacterium]
MQTFTVFFLAAILSTCPLLCRAAEVGCCAGQREEDGHGTPRPPASCPDDGVTCISAGAIQADEVSLPAPDDVGHPQPLAAPTALGTRLLTGRAFPSTPVAFATARCDGARLRALLQNFRF